MKTIFSPARAIVLVLLTAAWCGLWGSASIANVGSGFAVGVLALATTPSHRPCTVRPVPLVRLGLVIAADLAQSTYQVAREVLTPTDYTQEGIIAVELPAGASDHLLLLTSAITLTPGTAVVETDGERNTIYLHLLHLERRDQVEDHVCDLARLAIEALPVQRGGR